MNYRDTCNKNDNPKKAKKILKKAAEVCYTIFYLCKIFSNKIGKLKIE